MALFLEKISAEANNPFETCVLRKQTFSTKTYCVKIIAIDFYQHFFDPSTQISILPNPPYHLVTIFHRLSRTNLFRGGYKDRDIHSPIELWDLSSHEVTFRLRAYSRDIIKTRNLSNNNIEGS